MKKILESSSAILLFAIILITGISGCGSESNSNNTDKKIKVTIPFDLSAKALQKSNQISNSNNFYAPAPSNVRSVRVDAVYPYSNNKITRIMDVSGGTNVEVVMDVDEGSGVFFTAYAYDGYAATGNLLYAGVSSSQILEIGMSYDIIIQMAADNNTPPAVSSASPSNGATGVPTTGIITIIFSETMDPSTINTSTITTSPGPGISINYSGTTATLTPTTDFLASTTYTVTVTTGVKDLAGNPMASSYTWSFTTAGGGDTTPPTVSSATPTGTSVPTNSIIAIIFSEAIAIDNTTITLKDSSGATVNGTASYSGTTATFTPSAFLTPSMTYTTTISTHVWDLAGNAMTSSYSWSFTTGAGGDTTPPTVSSVSPAPSAIGVPTTGIITIIFSEPMSPSTITTSTITTSPGPGMSINYSGTTATLTPTTGFVASTTYTVTVTTGVKDLAGNPMASSYSWSFTTAGGGDTTPPTVSSATPTGTSVPTNSIIAIIFSEAIAIDNTTITLKDSSGATVNGTASYSGTTATFTPSAFLTPSMTYTTTISTHVWDLAGNAMTSSYSWSFTTGATSDTTKPTVSSVSPAPGATGVPTTGIITIIFSEAMDPTTITTSTITTSPGPGMTINYSGTTATLTPTTGFVAGTIYTVTVTTGVKDMAGNTMLSDYPWSFRTQ